MTRGDRESDYTSEVYRIPPQAEELLSIAEGYSQTDSELERARAQQTPPVIFFDFHAEEHARLDKVAYSAYVEQYDPETYPENSKVDVEFAEGTVLTATLLSA